MVDQTRLLSETDAMNVLSILRFSLTVSADSVILSWMISLGMFLQDRYLHTAGRIGQVSGLIMYLCLSERWIGG